jgi:hypothetical protein
MKIGLKSLFSLSCFGFYLFKIFGIFGGNSWDQEGGIPYHETLHFFVNAYLTVSSHFLLMDDLLNKAVLL